MFKQLFDRIINQPKVPTNEEEEPERYLVTFDNIGEVLNSDLGKGNEKISKVLESIEGQRYLSEKDKDALWHACDVAQWRYDIYNEKMRKRVVAEHFDNMQIMARDARTAPSTCWGIHGRPSKDA